MTTEQLKYFEEYLINFYGGENVGYFEWSSLRGLSVHFNELLITTSDNMHTHLIKDIYFIFDKDLYIRCFRGTTTDMEYIRGYLHSHIPKNDQGGLFCTGTSPYSRIAQELRMGNNIELNAQALVVAFNEMIRVESLEGVPYCNIENLKKGYNKETPIQYDYPETCSFRDLGELLNIVKKEDLSTLITFLNFLIREKYISGEYGSYKYAIVNNTIYDVIRPSEIKKLSYYPTIKYQFKNQELTTQLLKSEITFLENICLPHSISYYFQVWKNIVTLINCL